MFRLTSGKCIVGGIVLLGVLLAAANVAFRYGSTHRIHERWGAEALGLIADAPHVELLTLSPELATPQVFPSRDDEPSTLLQVAGLETLRIASRTDIVGTKGLVHLRYALGQDGSYDWSADDAAEASAKNARTVNGKSPFAIRFADEGREVALIFDAEAELVRCSATNGDAVRLSANMTTGILTIVKEARKPR